MFGKLFSYIEDGVFNAILRAIQRADDTVSGKLEADEPVLIEFAEEQPKGETKTNGKAPAKRKKAASRS